MTYSSSFTSNRKDTESIKSHISARSQKILEKTKDEIDTYNDDLEKLSTYNLKLRKKEKKLSDQLDVITRALEKNVSTSSEINRKIEEENEEMMEEIRRRKEQMDIVKPLIDKCLAMNPTIFQDNGNLEILLNQVRQNEISQNYAFSLDPLLNKILPGIEYFKDCKTNNEFLERCKLIMNEIKRLEKKKNDLGNSFEEEFNRSNITVLRKQLSIVQNKNNEIQIDYSEKIKELTREKQQLLEEKRRLVDSQISSSKLEIPRTPTRRSSTMIQKSPVSTTLFTPIMKKKQISSPLKFD